jgi:hypothetical protein
MGLQAVCIQVICRGVDVMVLSAMAPVTPGAVAVASCAGHRSPPNLNLCAVRFQVHTLYVTWKYLRV